MKCNMSNLLTFLSIYAFVFISQQSIAQTATINLTVTPASCSGLGSVSGTVSVPGACSVDGFLPCTNASLSGPGQSGNTFNTCDGFLVGASNLVPGNYVYTVTAISPCSGTATFPFTVEQEGVFPAIETSNTEIDCSDDDFVTVQNTSSATVNIGELGGPSLGSIPAGQSEDFTHQFLGIPFSGNFTFTASTSSCPTPVEYEGQYPDGLSTVTATVSTTNASNGQSNGSASIVGTGTFGPWTINWSNGVTTTDINTGSIENLAPGNYSVEIIGGNGCSYSESFVIFDGDPTGVDNLASVLGEVKLFPNPASGKVVNLKVDAFKAQRVSISVINTLGQEVVPLRNFELAQGSAVLTLDLHSGLPGGIYYVQVIADKKVGSLPLMVQD